MASFDWDHMVIRWVAFIGGAATAVSQSERAFDDPKLWVIGIAGGCAALGLLLRPPGVPKPEKEIRG